MTSDRLELFSRALGEDNAPDLVILHGLLGTSDNWQTLGKRFAETHRVHLIDQRNHGRSPHHPVHSYEAMAEDLLHYLDELYIQRASIIGVASLLSRASRSAPCWMSSCAMCIAPCAQQ